jgi:hypothetical protein
MLLIYPIKDMEAAVGNTIKSSNTNSYSKYSITSSEGNVNSTSVSSNDNNCEMDSKCNAGIDKIMYNAFGSEEASENGNHELEDALNPQNEDITGLSQENDNPPY